MLSNRGRSYLKMRYMHGNKEKDLFGPENRDGVVDFSNAFNYTMQEKMARYLSSKTAVAPNLMSYNEGYTGTERLRKAMAVHVNEYFHPHHAVDAEDITFMAGVTALNEMCALVVCDPGERDVIMLGRPCYGAFGVDMITRTEVELLWVAFNGIDQFSMDAVACYEKALLGAQAKGIKVRALVISNPHNPLGECYPAVVLVSLMKLCQKYDMHFISDEIYALSCYEPRRGPAQVFTSVLSIDIEGIIDSNLVHSLYGMAKDFAAAGLRLGCLITRNQEFTQAVRSLCRFCSPSQLSDALSATFLEDRTFVRDFLIESSQVLSQHRRLTEETLDDRGIAYHKAGNAGLFVWIDLSSILCRVGPTDDTWAAQDALAKRFADANIKLSNGRPYHDEIPGQYRVVISVNKEMLVEGLERIIKIVDEYRT